MSKYDVGDVVVLLPDEFTTQVYWGQPLEVYERHEEILYCKCPEGFTWLIDRKSIKGFYKNEEV